VAVVAAAAAAAAAESWSAAAGGVWLVEVASLPVGGTVGTVDGHQ
jgi:hypothetical protein